MSFGILIKNTSGDVIIAEDYKIYSLYSNGTIDNSSTLPSVSGTDILFVSPSSIGYTIYADVAGNGSRIKSTSGYVDWAICKESSSVVGGNSGIVVYQSTGTVAFDSSKRSMNPVFVARKAGLTDNEVITTISISLPALTLSSRKRYINSASMRLTGFVDDGSGVTNWWVGTFAAWNSNTSMVVGEQAIIPSFAPIGTPQGWGGNLFFSFADI